MFSVTNDNIDTEIVNRRRVAVQNSVGDHNPPSTVTSDLNSYAIMKVCRVCLVRNVKMYHVSEHRLSAMFERVAGIQINSEDKLPKMLCWECVARLSSANKFVEKALKSHWIMLKKIKGDKFITMSDIESIDKDKYQLESTLRLKFYKVNHSNVYIRESTISSDGNENSFYETYEEINNDDDDDKEKITVKHEYTELAEELNETDLEMPKPMISIKENLNDDEESIMSEMSGEEHNVVEQEDDVVKKENRKRKHSRGTTLQNQSERLSRLKEPKLVLEDEMLNLIKKNNQNFVKNLTNNDQPTKDTDTEYHVPIKTESLVGNGNIFVESNANIDDTNNTETIITENIPDFKNTSESDSIKTDTVNSISIHHDGESPKKGFICNICNKTFVHKSSLSRHTKEHSNVFNCTYCSYQTNMKCNFARHVNSKHTKNIIFTCPDCDYKAYTKLNLNKHISAKHSKGTVLKCDSCNYGTNDKGSLNKHINSVHFKGTLSNCIFCSYSTYRKGSLTEHVNAIHTKYLVFNCTYCDYKTYDKRYLNKHINVKHTKDTVFKCSYCSYETYLRSNLTVHVNAKHTKKTMFKCSYCSYETYLRNNFNRHIQVKHTKDTVFNCSYCSYKTYLQRNLGLHINAKHTRNNRFKCTYCEYETSLKNNLDVHVNAKHTKSIVFKCSHCSYESYIRSNLAKHVKTKHGSNQSNTSNLSEIEQNK